MPFLRPDAYEPMVEQENAKRVVGGASLRESPRKNAKFQKKRSTAEKPLPKRVLNLRAIANMSRTIAHYPAKKADLHPLFRLFGTLLPAGELLEPIGLIEPCGTGRRLRPENQDSGLCSSDRRVGRKLDLRTRDRVLKSVARTH